MQEASAEEIASASAELASSSAGSAIEKSGGSCVLDVPATAWSTRRSFASVVRGKDAEGAGGAGGAGGAMGASASDTQHPVSDDVPSPNRRRSSVGSFGSSADSTGRQEKREKLLSPDRRTAEELHELQLQREKNAEALRASKAAEEAQRLQQRREHEAQVRKRVEERKSASPNPASHASAHHGAFSSGAQAAGGDEVRKGCYHRGAQ